MRLSGPPFILFSDLPIFAAARKVDVRIPSADYGTNALDEMPARARQSEFDVEYERINGSLITSQSGAYYFLRASN
jgi:hypothetical protein